MADKRSLSKQTNRKALLPGLDGRSAGARRFRDLVGQISTDLGGIDTITESRLQLVKRFCAACVLSEQLESRLAAGAVIDIVEHGALVSSLCRLSSRIGLDRIPTDITNSAHQWATRVIIDPRDQQE
jgi:hypothetical protein